MLFVEDSIQCTSCRCRRKSRFY